jgi:hypothetical protein
VAFANALQSGDEARKALADDEDLDVGLRIRSDGLEVHQGPVARERGCHAGGKWC